MEFRPLAESDIDALHQLHLRSEQHDQYPLTTSRAELVELWESNLFDPELHSRVAFDGDRMIAFGHIYHRPSEVRLENAYIIGHIDPEIRRSGVGSALFSWQVEQAKELLQARSHDLPKFILADAYEWGADRQALIGKFGFEVVRYFDDMMRTLDDLPALRPVDGFEVLAWNPDRSEDARLAKNEAFMDHWGTTPTNVANWNEWLESHTTRLDLSFMALHDGAVVGVCINAHFPEDEGVTGRREGWTESLSVVSKARGRGLASALLVESLHAFAGADFTHAALDVDSDSPTGAGALYRKLGYELQRRAIVYHIEV